MKKKWKKPTFYLIDRDSVKNGNHNGFNESTIIPAGANSSSGHTTRYFMTAAHFNHTITDKGNPTNYFS